ncbi:DoxX family protein [Kordiimonas marina]|uniref:DoxX family protein n=1 Tax=Kordiimonas marina TaxID=2872312 RepID=UPI001FF5C90D|nr:DoxX family protein [Kordiimonas marina]MCJ9430355.1 DoxX family protein [Kordiimonas marina]
MAKIQAAQAFLQEKFQAEDFMLLWLRMWIAHVFFVSGRLKTGGSLLTPTDMAITLFQDEYRLPLISPEVAAYMSVYAETFLPILLMLGLFARVGAAGLLGMALVIQFLVYPGHFSEHLTWMAALLAILVLGAGRVSLDHLIQRFSRRT